MKYLNKKITTSALYLLLGITSLLSFGACSNAVTHETGETNVTDQAGNGTLNLELSSNARTIRPTDTAAYTIVSYQVSGTGPGGSTFDSGTVTSSVFSKTTLLPGVWTITVRGINTGANVIAQTVLPVTITGNQTTSVRAALERKAGNGTLSVGISWLSANEFDAIAGTITPAGGTAVPVTFTIDTESSASYINILPAGNYVLNLTLKKSGITLDTLTESVQIFSDYTSSASYNRAVAALPADFTYTTAAPVYAVDFMGASSRQIIVKGAEGKQVYLVKTNTGTSAVPSGNTGFAASAFEVSPYSASRTAEAPVFIPAPGKVVRYENTEAAAFNANPPPITRSSSSKSLPGMAKNELVSYGGASAYNVNTSTKLFWVQNSLSAWIQVTATLRSIGNYCYIWVVNANYDNTSTLLNDNKVTTAQITALKDKFDGTAGNSYNDGIFKNVTTIFGYEYGGGTGGTGGQDTDQHISILVYDIDGDYVSAQTGGVLGFFWGKDFYTQAAIGATPKTNYCEMFYIDSHFTDQYPGLITSTLAHEYQHMIQFNQKSVSNSLNSAAWFNEMCSMVAEDLVLANIGLDPVIDGAQNRLPDFSYHYAESGVSDWLDNPNVLKSYASAFAFGAYLARNYGGATFFKNLLSNTQVNETAITAALATGGYTDTFDGALKHYGEALVYTDIPAGSSVKTLKQTNTTTIGGISYTASPIDYAAVQQYNAAAGWVAGAFGPRTYAPASTVTLRPYGNSIHTQASWTALAGDLPIVLTAPIDTNVKYYLMVK